MRPDQFIGYHLVQASAISALVGSAASARVYYGLRPETTITPCINYYEVGGGSRFSGMERATYSVNCRAGTAAEARALARAVVTVFAGDSGTGTYGSASGLSVARAALVSDGGLIPESEDRLFNAPVDVQLVYAPAEVS